MNEKSKIKKSKTCGAKRFLSKLASITAHLFETVWAMGVSVAAAMAISTPIYCAGLLKEFRAWIVWILVPAQHEHLN